MTWCIEEHRVNRTVIVHWWCHTFWRHLKSFVPFILHSKLIWHNLSQSWALKSQSFWAGGNQSEICSLQKPFLPLSPRGPLILHFLRSGAEIALPNFSFNVHHKYNVDIHTLNIPQDQVITTWLISQRWYHLRARGGEFLPVSHSKTKILLF